MNEIIERAAAEVEAVISGDVFETERAMYLAIVRATLAAIRKPTEAMLMAAGERPRDEPEHYDYEPPSTVWDIMINEAMK